MQIDLRAVAFPAEALRAEVCIIGAGIAGILLARRLAETGKDVILLEAGGFALGDAALHPPPDPAIDWTPCRQTNAGRIEMPGYVHPGSVGPPAEVFGGTSLTWGGQLLPRDEATALDCPISSNPAWPVTPAQLAPYYTEAERVLGVNDLPYAAPSFFVAANATLPPLFAGVPDTTLRVSKFAPFSHRNLAETLGRELLGHDRVRVILGARATELVCRNSGEANVRSIDAVLVRATSGKVLRITAGEFIVAAGTLESVRLLLASGSRNGCAVGQEHEQLGRNVHDHLTLTAAVFTGPARKLMLEQLRPWVVPAGDVMTVHSVKLEASPALRARLGLQHVMAHLTIEEPEDSAMGALRAILKDRQGKGIGVAGWLRELRHLLPALEDAARLAWWARVRKRRYVSPQARVVLRLNGAQRTPSDSKISLSETLDKSGQPKPVLQWMIANEEVATLVRFAAHLRESLGELAGDAGVQWTPSLFPAADAPKDLLLRDLTDARHLMGGAVMGADPRTSVVDANLRVHGVANLHVVSLATFPDGSAQLPTLTLMALALRLADHLSCKAVRL